MKCVRQEVTREEQKGRENPGEGRGGRRGMKFKRKKSNHRGVILNG